jgi:hypothetical protein
MLEEPEKRRLDTEVLSPLDDLGEDRFPRTAQEIAEAVRRKDTKENKRTAEELGRIQDSLKGVLERMSDTEDFSDILHRLDSVLELHRRAIQTTRDRIKEAPK